MDFYAMKNEFIKSLSASDNYNRKNNNFDRIGCFEMSTNPSASTATSGNVKGRS